MASGFPPSIPSGQDGRPAFLDAFQTDGPSSYRATPEIANGIERQLNITSSEDTDEDSLDVTDESSIEDEGYEAPSYGLPLTEKATGLCYDDRMRFHSEVSAPSGDSVHPEDPRRIYYIFKELCEAGLADDGIKHFKPLIGRPLKRIDARQATKEECCLVLTLEHYNFVKSTSKMTNEELIDLSEAKEMDSVYFNQFSYISAKFSAGGAIETCKAVVRRDVRNAIAVIRPPGHHAEVHCSMGFCMFNNVCIASKVCQAAFGKDCRKILILDWDVHHGNGCQKAHYDDPSILYISIHVHKDGHFYPATTDGDMHHVGEGAGVGFNVNIPWPTQGMGDGDYMYAFQQLVMPIASEFDPDLVIVAAGFDAAAGDELGGCFVSPACYAHMTHMLMSLANGKVAVCLEGGYNLQSISKSALAVTRTLMGEPPDRLDATAATQSAVETVQQVKNIQSIYWRSLYPKDPIGGIFGGERLHDIIREWQAKRLYDDYKLTNLHIFRDNISKSFDNQVLASPNYETKKRLIVLFHDPPDVMKTPGTLSNEIKPYETFLVDGTQSYISWAISHNFGLITINIPQYITLPSTYTSAASMPPSSPSALVSTNALHHSRTTMTQVSRYSAPTDPLGRQNSESLALYLWENYIEPHTFPHGLFLLGAGDAFNCVAKLLSDNDGLYQQVSGVVGWIAQNPVRTVKSSTGHGGPWLEGWYRENSRVFVASSHLFWARYPEMGSAGPLGGGKREGKRPKKQYGRVERSEGKTLGEVMQGAGESVGEWILERSEALGGEGEGSDDYGEAGDERSVDMVPGTFVEGQDVEMA